MASQQPTPSPINGLPPPVEHQFQPGRSGNPGGMSKKRLISNAMNRLLELAPDELATYRPKTVAESLALDIVRNASADPRFTTHALDRTEGKVPDELKVDSDGAGLRIVLAEATPPNTDASAPGVMASTEEGTSGSEPA